MLLDVGRQWQWRRFGLASVMALAVFVLVAGCGTDDPNPSEPNETQREPVAVDSYLVEGATVTLIVRSCYGEPQGEVTQSEMAGKQESPEL